VATERRGSGDEELGHALYALTPPEFTAARDELARRLRADGDTEAAAAVRGLRRPTLAAWSVNQLARRFADRVDALLEAGRRLRAAQAGLGGRTGADELRAAARDRRALVDELAERASWILETSGAQGAAHLDAVRSTLEAASLDDDAARRVRAGRLDRELRAPSGFGAAEAFDLPSASRSPAPTSAPRAARGTAREQSTREKRERARREVESRRAAARDAQRAVQHAEKAEEAARRRVRDLDAKLADARTELQAASAASARARREQEAASGALATAEEGLRGL
jgi:hypothetical protein